MEKLDRPPKIDSTKEANAGGGYLSGAAVEIRPEFEGEIYSAIEQEMREDEMNQEECDHLAMIEDLQFAEVPVSGSSD